MKKKLHEILPNSQQILQEANTFIGRIVSNNGSHWVCQLPLKSIKVVMNAKIKNVYIKRGTFVIVKCGDSGTDNTSTRKSAFPVGSVFNTGTKSPTSEKENEGWGEIVSVLFQDDIKLLKKLEIFPVGLELGLEDSVAITKQIKDSSDDEVFVNTNRHYSDSD